MFESAGLLLARAKGNEASKSSQDGVEDRAPLDSEIDEVVEGVLEVLVVLEAD